MDNEDKSKSFKSIEELLNIEGSENDVKFDDTEAQIELKKLEERKQFLTEYKQKLVEYGNLGNAEYKLKVTRDLIDSGLLMLAALQKEIIDNPTGRDVECVSSLMNSINQTIDTINKMDFFERKMKIEDEKLNIKKISNSKDSGGDNITQNNIYFSTVELLDLIKKENLKTIDVQVEK